MFLRSLTLKGFKSFAEAATLELEPGITVVVGPNGSGKSNLVDAVAWVLGAQGPRTVRSGRMDDVIFAGTGSRSPLGRAEVTLTIDNSAGVLPIDLTEVTVTRTLFRSSGESEYALNGAPCRLLDIQELLSDAGVGRQQHVIVSQGQLDAVLDARPEERRMIVEEAAGILKFRRRKEKAQRRLEATEADLLRLADLLREVRRQLRPLERQAEATRRHDGLSDELRAVRLHVGGREIASLRARVQAGGRALVAVGDEERELRTELAGTDRSIAASESWLAAVGDTRLDEAVGRLEALRERAKGVAAVVAERRRSVERDRRAVVEQGLVESLEDDARRLAAEAAEVEAATAALGPDLERLAAGEAEVGRLRQELEARSQQAPPSGAARLAEVRAELSVRRATVERERAEQARLQNRQAAIDDRLRELDELGARRRAELEEAARERNHLAAELDRVAAVLAEAESEVQVAEAGVAALESRRRALDARVDALAQALGHTRPWPGPDELTGIEGALGSLADLVAVDEGWEAAFEAAAGGALAAAVVEGTDAARQALSRLSAGDHGAAVLALGDPMAGDPMAGDPMAGDPMAGDPMAGDSVPGASVPGASVPGASVPGASVPGASSAQSPALPGPPLRSHVRSSHPGVEALLDVLLAPVAAVEGTWEEALEASIGAPGAIVVTRAGDRFAPDGWRVGGGPRAIEVALANARDDAVAADEETLARTERLGVARATAESAARARDERARALADHDRVLAGLAEALGGLDGQRRDLTAGAEPVVTALAEHAQRLTDDDARLATLEQALPALEAEEAAGAELAAAIDAERRRVRERADAQASLATELEIRRAGLAQRHDDLARRRADVQRRLDASGATAEVANARRAALDVMAARTGALAAVVDGLLSRVEAHLADTRLRRQRQLHVLAAASTRLDGLRRSRAEGERRLEAVREQARRIELEEAEGRMRLEAAVDALRRELDVEPDVAVEAPCPELPPGTSPQSRVRELERELRLLGPVNPLATEELAALQERNQFLEGQLDDVKTTRRELGRVIRAVDAEISQLLSAAFADVADNFTRLFETLFPGGEGRLRLTGPADDLLEAGIEIEGRPAGKNVRRLSLLSGGERSLVALAFLFAVFRSRPSPFYLLDEVEAALDDVNLHRFLDLLAEFREEAQLLVVTHQKRTMEAADCLYGVTMQPGGTSLVVSERVRAPGSLSSAV